MNPLQVLTSFTFRYMLFYVVGLSAAVFLVMAFIFSIFSYNYFQDLQESIAEELESLTVIYAGQGIDGVEQYFADQATQENRLRFHYLLTDNDFGKIAGTLDSWPEYQEFGDGWLSFGLDTPDLGFSDENLEFLARTQELGDGLHVLAALRYSDVLADSRLVMVTLVRTMLATVILGVFGGYLAAAYTLRRIAAINTGIDDIVHGDLSQRIPLGDAVGNMRVLVENFNQMLDQTESLMQGVRTVSDNIAHDLRTPLTRMRNNLSLLQEESDTESARVQLLIDECDSILSTFNALLRIAQLEAGNRLSTFTPLHLEELVADVVELYEPLAQAKHIALYVHTEVAQINGDRDLLFQMMANLLDNAVKYTPEGGEISVLARPGEEGGAQLSVADSGPGIPVADRKNVFRRFIRLESSRGMQPGSGLGLSLVSAVVSAHRGSIKLTDNYPGLRVLLNLP
jgi:signal transduction histidine kinase